MTEKNKDNLIRYIKDYKHQRSIYLKSKHIYNKTKTQIELYDYYVNGIKPKVWVEYGSSTSGCSTVW